MKNLHAPPRLAYLFLPMDATPPPPTRMPLLVGIFWSLILSWMLTAVAANLHYRFVNRAETIQHQFAILDGKPLLFSGEPAPLNPWRNRLLFPYTLRAATNFGGLGVEQWYLLLRIGWGFVSLLAVFLVLHRITASTDAATIGLAVLSFLLLPTFLTNGWEVPSDYPDAAFTALFAWAALERRRWTLALLAMVSCWNRESGAFAGVLWFFLHAWRGGLRLFWSEAVFGGIVSIACYGLAIVLRNLHGSTQAVVSQEFVIPIQWAHIQQFLHHPSPFAWPIVTAAGLAVPLGIIWQRRAFLDNSDRRILLTSLVITVISLPVGMIDELRVFLPTLTLLVVVSARVLARSRDQLSVVSDHQHA